MSHDDKHGDDFPPTPRTDAALVSWAAFSDFGYGDSPYVEAEFARQLELELLEANKFAERMRDATPSAIERCDNINERRGETRDSGNGGPSASHERLQTTRDAAAHPSFVSSSTVPFTDKPLAYYNAANMTFHRRDEITAEQRERFVPLYEFPPSVVSSAIGPMEVLNQAFALCEATEELPDGAGDSQEQERYLAGRRFEAKHIRRALGTWFKDASSDGGVTNG